MHFLLPGVMVFGASVEPSEPLRPDQAVGALTATVTPQEIEGGRVTDPGEHEAVIALRPHLKICSGVMVSSTVLLTAAHCVAEIGFGQHITMYHGSTVDDARRYQADSWAAHPSYCPDCRDDWFDIGYVTLTLPYELAEGASGYATPIVTQDEWDELMQAGRPLQVVGYGSGEGSAEGPHTKRVAEVELADLTRSGRELHAQSTNGSTDDGDSGGAYFTTGRDGELRLVGIHSRTDRRDDTMIATPPFPMLCWLRDETGVDLLPPQTTDCSTLDTSSGGCRVAPGGTRPFVLLGLLIALGPRRKRRAAMRANR